MKSYFWGIFLISTGVFLLIKHYFNLNVSTGRVVIGLFLLSLGASILIGGFGVSAGDRIMFREGTFKYDPSEDEYEVIFSEARLSFDDFVPKDKPVKVEVTCVFGSLDLVLPKDAKVYIDASCAFGQIDLPDGSDISFFGNHRFTDNVDKNEADLIIDLSTVFGKTEIRR